MQVTSSVASHATQELRRNAMPDRPQSGAGWGVVEHPDPARRLSWADAFRSVPEEPGYRTQHADAPAQRAGRIRASRTPPLQRTAAPRRICADRTRPGFSTRALGDTRLGQQAFRAG